jgi:hypothetical protein
MHDPTQNENQQEGTDQLRQQLQKLIMPILATRRDGKVKCIGTGFLIVTDGRQALMVTAAHNFDWIRKIDNLNLAYYPSVPESFRPEIYRFELRNTKPRAMYYSGGKAHKALIEATVQMTKADLALCSIPVQLGQVR